MDSQIRIIFFLHGIAVVVASAVIFDVVEYTRETVSAYEHPRIITRLAARNYRWH
jgi:hypothetical protein